MGPPPTARLGITCLALAAVIDRRRCRAVATVTGDPSTSPSSTAALDELLTAATLTYDELRLETSAHGVLSTAGSPPREISFDSRVDLVVGHGDVAVELDGERTRLIADGDRFWVSSDAESFTGVVPDGKEWVALRPEDLERSTVVAPPQPSIFTAYVRGASNAERRDDRILFEIDLDKAVAALCPSTAARTSWSWWERPMGMAAATGEATIEPTGHLGRITVDVRVSCVLHRRSLTGRSSSAASGYLSTSRSPTTPPSSPCPPCLRSAVRFLGVTDR